MKKKLILCLCIVMCVCILCGCECKHEWTDANCTEAAVCSKCGATEGEALGHSWTKASCSSPATCSVCSLTEGVTLEHEFGEWSATDDETMSRSCQNCGLAEEQPLDRELMFKTLMAKTMWRAETATDLHGSYYSVYDEYIIDLRVDENLGFVEDSLSLVGDIVYFDYTDDGDTAYYSFTFSYHNSYDVVSLLYTRLSGEDGLYILMPYDDDLYMIFELDPISKLYGKTMVESWNYEHYLSGDISEDHTYSQGAGNITIDDEGNVSVALGLENGEYTEYVKYDSEFNIIGEHVVYTGGQLEFYSDTYYEEGDKVYRVIFPESEATVFDALEIVVLKKDGSVQAGICFDNYTHCYPYSIIN